MSAPPVARMTPEEYDRAAQAYQASLPLEHYMEATPQATQRAVTMASASLIRRARQDVHYFSELLVQYFFKGNLRQVVPDNMLVLGQLSEKERGSYATELEPNPLFWVLEYVSENNKRKDYVDNFQKYEQELKVPYYLIFDPETQDLRLYHHDGTAYVPVAANSEGRYAVPELEVEVGLLEGWVRFWFGGKLLGLPTELQEEIDQLQKQLRERDEKLRQRDEELRQRDEELRQRDEELRQRDQQLANAQREHDQQMQALAASLRPLVEVRARQAGRQDILARLPETADSNVLTRWLTELA